MEHVEVSDVVTLEEVEDVAKMLKEEDVVVDMETAEDVVVVVQMAEDAAMTAESDHTLVVIVDIKDVVVTRQFQQDHLHE